ncbi:hypothetical protein [Pantoea ananatis]|uniref:hypothetical protein n=1 Tax=Pantoea ananas TaxID=553 RepID=UPI0021F74EC5|nr:hypothetical protein [Pantoea ananatis]MCW0330964.1 hypothetical protein [Pantoea ananatis]MCW0350858.1 hypothetical protein [Pantoea ananatis]
MEAQKGWLILIICSSPLLFAFGHLSGHRLRPHQVPARENDAHQAYAAVILLRLYSTKPDGVTKKGPITDRAFAYTRVIHGMSDAVISTAVLYG